MSDKSSYYYRYVDINSKNQIHFWNKDLIPKETPKTGDVIDINYKKYRVVNIERHSEEELLEIKDHGSDYHYKYYTTIFVQKE